VVILQRKVGDTRQVSQGKLGESWGHALSELAI
jgi:hypothetical protein